MREKKDERERERERESTFGGERRVVGMCERERERES